MIYILILKIFHIVLLIFKTSEEEEYIIGNNVEIDLLIKSAETLYEIMVDSPWIKIS